MRQRLESLLQSCTELVLMCTALVPKGFGFESCQLAVIGGSCKSGMGQLTRSVVGRVTSWTISLFGS